MIGNLAVAGYRSLRDVRLPLGRLTVIRGGNGVGKSSLYQAVRLLADTAGSQPGPGAADGAGVVAR